MILNFFVFTFPKKRVGLAMGNETFYGDGLIAAAHTAGSVAVCKVVNANPEIKVNRSIEISCLQMFFRAGLFTLQRKI